MIHETLPLWGPGAYFGELDDGFEPMLETYILDGENTRPAVLICPGGGYGFRSPRESEPVALQFNAAGYHAFVLHYSVAPRRHPLPLLDASRAMYVIRERTAEWNVKSNAVAICGFSAGAHLAAHLGTCWNRPEALWAKGTQNAPSASGIATGLNRPDALILCYPVITAGEFAHTGSIDNLLGPGATDAARRSVSLEFAVGPDTPPAFIWHTFADQAVPLENSLLFAGALRKAGVPFELHVYHRGLHGLSLATPETSDDQHCPDPHIATWIELCVEWLGERFG
ncbi:MAG: alpha/beta hydrolase, partial [Spirochaetes bacterium]|nr:alpha/beta hydrolase [Spirochaetota bacterium]